MSLGRLSLKLGLVLFLAVAGALAIVYLAVLPQLESRLVNAKITELERSARTVGAELEGRDQFLYQDTADALAASFSARVVVFERLKGLSLRVIADSSSVGSTDIQGDRVTLQAARSGLPATGRVEREAEEFAEAAVLVDPDTIVLLSAPLGDALANVRLVRKSLVTAGSFALFISWLAGFGAAWNITRRLNRLETAAERIAGGDFEAPVEVDGRDEIGQLAAAFESMRLRLANLDRARREFIANASHELRTPLFSLGGFLELLVDEELEEATRREFLREMRAQVDRLTRLATDLLDLTRLDAGQLSVDIGKFDLAKVARTVVDEFGPVAEADGRALELVVDPTVLAAGDELRVQQITRILVENALRHTPSGTAVEVSIGRWEARALLAVRDAGPGIPPSDQEHLFERFYRAGGGKTSGSGLGLAIAQELALRMAGTLRMASAPGKTTFTLSLPLVGSLERAEEAETPEPLLT